MCLTSPPVAPERGFKIDVISACSTGHDLNIEVMETGKGLFLINLLTIETQSIKIDTLGRAFKCKARKHCAR